MSLPRAASLQKSELYSVLSLYPPFIKLIFPQRQHSNAFQFHAYVLVDGSIPPPGTIFKTASVKGLRASDSFQDQPERRSKYPRRVPSCARENLSVACPSP